MRLPVINTNGASAAQISHQRGALMRASRNHCSAALRVVASRSRVRCSSSRYMSGTTFTARQKRQTIEGASTTTSGALQLTHSNGANLGLFSERVDVFT